MRFKLGVFLLFFLVLFVISFVSSSVIVSAQDVVVNDSTNSLVNAFPYYADIDIYVQDNGLVSIDGDTNNPSLLVLDSSNFTSKKNAFWIFNLTTNDNFSDILFRLHLPAGAAINYLRTPDLSRIKVSSNGIIIIGTGENQSLILLVQYTIDSNYKASWNSYLAIPLIIILVIIGFLFRKKKFMRFARVSQDDVSSVQTDEDVGSKLYEKFALSERQLMIVKFIEKNGGSVLQSKAEKELDMPKSSLSRNIASLERKGIIKKQSRGMSNMLSFIDNKKSS